MAILPTRKVEIAFDAGVWTDISADVVQIKTRRGRNAESGAFETGTCSLTVRNDTRKYDPDHASGPYYGKLRPNRVVRVQATYNAITYDVFYGYLDRITQNPGGPNAAAATIDASDLFKLLNRQELPVSVYAAEVAADNPTTWYRLGDPVGATVALDQIGAAHATYAGDVALGQAGLIVRDPDGAVNTGTTGEVQAPDSTTLPAGDWSMEVWFTCLPDGSTMALFSSTGQDYATLKVRATGVLEDYSGAAGTRVVHDGSPHHVVITRTNAGTITIYLDGTVEITHAAGAQAVDGPVWLSRRLIVLTAIIGKKATFDEFALYPGTILSAARVAAHNSAGRTPWNGDTPGARLGRIASLAAVTLTSLGAGTTTLQNTSLGGTALAYMQKVEETEIGRLFVMSNGTLRFVGRQEAEMGSYLVTKSTLVDADSGLGDEYRSVSAVVDEGAIVTRATVSRDGSVAITYTDAAAVTEFKTIDETHEGLLHDSDTYSLYYAQYLVNTKKAPTSRLGALQIELPSAPPTLYPNILGIELADRVQYKRKPQNTGAVTSQYMRVESIEHSTGGHYWTTLLQLSRYDQAGGVPVGHWDSALWDQAVWGL